MNPALSGVVVGLGIMALFVFCVAKVDQIRQEGGERLFGWQIRLWSFWELVKLLLLLVFGTPLLVLSVIVGFALTFWILGFGENTFRETLEMFLKGQETR